MSSRPESLQEREHTKTPHPINWTTIAVITLLFAAIYVVLRNLPNTQCGILHYEVTQETADGIEMCADGPAGMMDLNRIKFPGRYVTYTKPAAKAGVPYPGEFAITGPKGDALLPHEIAITHAEKIHLIAVDATLSDYHHLHPTPISNSGHWQYTFTPRLEGTYDIYVECVPLRTRKQLIVNSSLDVEAGGSPRSQPPPATLDSSDLQLDWVFSQTPIREGSWIDFTISLTHADGSPLALERFMDAYSHVVAFREGTTGYAHIHPIESQVSIDLNNPVFAFTFFGGEKGNYRFWAQFQINGKSVFIPHDVDVH